MKYLFLNLGLIFLLMSSGCNGVKPTFEAGFETDATRQKKIDEYFSTLTNLEQFNGVVLIQDENSDTFLKAYNLNPDENSSTYVTTKSQFDIHSVSKLFAKAILLEMEEKGQLKRTDLLSAYIPNFPNGDKITIQHLMDNTSGLPREPNVTGTTKNKLSDDEIIEWCKKEALEFEPGTDKRYSNVGYELLYYIIGKMNYSSFPVYLKTTFFPKIKMNNSGTHFYTDKSNLKKWAKNHQIDETIERVDNITSDDFKQSMLYSSAEDLQKFLKYLSTTTYRDALKSDNGIISWTGGSEGIRAHVHYNVEEDYSFVILANYDDIPLNDIIKTTSNIIEDKPYTLPKIINRTPITLDTSILSNYEGTYDFVDADHLLLDFKVENNQLLLYQEDTLMANLYAESDSVFFADPSSEESFEFKKVKGSYEVIAGWKGVKLKGIKK